MPRSAGPSFASRKARYASNRAAPLVLSRRRMVERSLGRPPDQMRGAAGFILLQLRNATRKAPRLAGFIFSFLSDEAELLPDVGKLLGAREAAVSHHHPKRLQPLFRKEKAWYADRRVHAH